MNAAFLAAVKEMRRLQRAWFGGDKSKSALVAAKAAERIVDKMIRDIDGEREPGLLFDILDDE